MHGGFRDDISVEAVAEIDRVDVVTVSHQGSVSRSAQVQR